MGFGGVGNVYVDGEENVNEDVDVKGLVERGWCTAGVQKKFLSSKKYFSDFVTSLALLQRPFQDVALPGRPLRGGARCPTSRLARGITF
jgi:hypothetical protein